MKRYYVIAVKAGMEETAIQNLKAQGFTTYNPRIQVTKTIRGKTIQEIVPLFAGYMFVQFNIKKDRWRAIQSTKGVYSLLTAAEDRCSPLPKGFVEGLRKRQRNGVIQPATVARIVRDFIQGEMLVVVDGAFTGQQGTCLAYNKSKRTVLMALLGQEIPVTFQSDNVAPEKS